VARRRRRSPLGKIDTRYVSRIEPFTLRPGAGVDPAITVAGITSDAIEGLAPSPKTKAAPAPVDGQLDFLASDASLLFSLLLQGARVTSFTTGQQLSSQGVVGRVAMPSSPRSAWT
jgi:hypothetical protein